MDYQDIHDTLPKLPASPGVYMMKDKDGAYLYIGKAIHLRNRIRSYFSSSHDNRFQIPYLLKKVTTIDWIATNNEIEALILEANLIRNHKPPYNIELKDDKHYPYLKVTTNEPFPRLFVVRTVVPDKAHYFGPYTDTTTMRRIMNLSKKIFKIRNCRKKLPLKNPIRPCINFAMDLCNGPCGSKITQEEYKENIVLLIKFLKGQHKDILTILKIKMDEASKRLAFENAATIRDQIKLIRKASFFQNVDLRTPKIDFDVFGTYHLDYMICLCVLTFKQGLLFSTRHFLVNYKLWYTGTPDRAAVILQYYQDFCIDPPNEIILPIDKGFEPTLLKSYFQQNYNNNIEIIIPQKGVKKELVEMAEKNARLYLIQNARLDPQTLAQNISKALHLPRIPKTIEAFDISNFGTTDTVAGMVHFRNGQPIKENYRRYKIKTVTGQNDFAMLMEAVERRLTRLHKEGKPFPDLLLIDGGKGQLSAASKPLARFPHPPMIVSLAKKEEILHSAYCENPVKLSSDDPALKLIQRIRDEVHRWAITYHRKIRDKGFNTSLLEHIPGIGKSKARLLLKAFKSTRNIRTQSISAIAQIRGISMSDAVHINDYFNSK